MTDLRVMTFNINGQDWEDEPEWTWWSARAALVTATIRRYAPHLIGLQEVVRANLDSFRQELPGYEFELGLDDGEEEYPVTPPIFWKRDRFERIDGGQFWLSPTPDIRAAAWGVPYPLGATWVRLRERYTGAPLLHINTHFEDGPDGELSRPESSKLIVARAAELAAGMPVFVTGDFNCIPWLPPYITFIEAGFVDSYRAAGNGDSVASSTFHGYEGEKYFAHDWGGEDGNLFWRVDWVLAHPGAGRLHTMSSTIVRDAAPPVFPSDHYPVISEFELV